MLGMADHKRKWEPTPYEGSVTELISMLIEQFTSPKKRYDSFRTAQPIGINNFFTLFFSLWVSG